MPYVAKGKCVYKRDTGKKVGCTKGSVKKYLTALRMHVNESVGEIREPRTGDYLLCKEDIYKKSGPEAGTLIFTKDRFYEIWFHEEHINIIQSNLDRDVNIYTDRIPDHFILVPKEDYDKLQGFDPFGLNESEEDDKSLGAKLLSGKVLVFDPPINREDYFNVFAPTMELLNIVWFDGMGLSGQSDRHFKNIFYNNNKNTFKYFLFDRVPEKSFKQLNWIMSSMESDEVLERHRRWDGEGHPSSSYVQFENSEKMDGWNFLKNYKSIIDFNPFDQLNESEDDLSWAEETVNSFDLSFRGKEYLIDVRNFTDDELNQLTEIIKPHLNEESLDNDFGDQNLGCIKKRYDAGKLKSISLHCGTEGNEYQPLKGQICCLSYTFEDESESNQKTITPIDGKSLLSFFKDSTRLTENDDTEWYENITLDIPDEFALTFCKTPITIELIKKFEGLFPEYKFYSEFTNGGMYNEKWVNNVTRYDNGRVVLYFDKTIDGIKWTGWDTCKINNLSYYKFVFDINDFLTTFGKKNITESEELEWVGDALTNDVWLGWDSVNEGDYIEIMDGNDIFHHTKGNLWNVVRFKECGIYNPNDWSVNKVPCMELSSVYDSRGTRWLTGQNIELKKTSNLKFKIIDTREMYRERGWKPITESDDLEWTGDILNTPLDLLRVKVYFDNGLTEKQWFKFKNLLRQNNITPISVIDLDDMDDSILSSRSKHMLFNIDENRTVMYMDLDLIRRNIEAGREYISGEFWKGSMSFDELKKYFEEEGDDYQIVNGYTITDRLNESDDLEWAQDAVKDIPDVTWNVMERNHSTNKMQVADGSSWLEAIHKWNSSSLCKPETRIYKVDGSFSPYELRFHIMVGGYVTLADNVSYIKNDIVELSTVWDEQTGAWNMVEKFLISLQVRVLNESEEDDFSWTSDILDTEVNRVINNRLELKNDDIIQINGVFDELEFTGDFAKVLSSDEVERNGYDILVIFNEHLNRNHATTHCANGTQFVTECGCEQEYDDYNGKCYFLNVGDEDLEIKKYPNRLTLTESKSLLTEGRYDALTRKVVKDIMQVVKSTRENVDDLSQADLPSDIREEEFEYSQEGMAFSVELNVHHQYLFHTRSATKESEAFYIHTAIADDDSNIILMTVVVDPDWEPRIYEKLFYKLQEDIRHEIEHFTQFGEFRISDRPTSRTDTAKLKTTYGHHKNKIEVPALVHGFYRRAKLEKRGIDSVMIEDLDSEIEKGNLSKKQAENLLKVWIEYSKKNLPKAIYDQE